MSGPKQKNYFSRFSFQEVAIEGVSFSFYSTEEIRKVSKFEVTTNKTEGHGSVNDPRSGPSDSQSLCQTCNLRWVQCYGHYGRIELPEKFINILAKPFVLQVLNSICSDCAKPLVTREELEARGILRFSGPERLKRICDYVDKYKKVCRTSDAKEAKAAGFDPCSCRMIYSEINRADQPNSYKVFRSIEKGQPTPVEISKIHDILKNISAADANLLGFDTSALEHPQHMIMEDLLVIPTCVRPKTVQGERTVEHDITQIYIDIMGKKLQLATKPQRDLAIADLYLAIVRLFKNAGTTAGAGANGKLHRSITELVQGKGGLIRENIMGKNVDYAGRTVISPGHRLRVDEVGIPRFIANRLTRPVRVHAANRDELQAELDARRVRYIQFAEKAQDRPLPINSFFYEKYKNYRLKIGDVVHRKLRDGDMVFINRQPTLTKPSFMGLRVRIIDEKSMRIPLPITIPQQADFDGDEMNLHIPQTYEAYAELEQLLSVERQLVDQRTNSAIIALTYDTLLGCYFMTRPDYKETGYAILPNEPDEPVDEGMWSYAISPVMDSEQLRTLDERLLRNGVPARSGRAIFSAALPETFSFVHNNGENNVLIRDGVLVHGQLNKSLLGKSDGGIIVEMTRQIGPRATIDFMSVIQFISNNYMNRRGFSIGLLDAIPHDVNVVTFVNNRDAKTEVKQVDGLTLINEAFEQGAAKIYGMTRPTSKLMEKQLEENIRSEIKSIQGKMEKISVSMLHKDNAILHAVQSGARGQLFNVVQFTAMIGQQCVEDKRIERSLPFGRTLPSFPYECDTLESQGYCRESLARGLRPSSLFFHMMATRENMTDTSQSTASSGSLSHRVVKTLEDSSISSERYVSGPNQIIIQPIYGYDGFDAGELQTMKVKGETFRVPIDIRQLCASLNQKYRYL